MLKSVDFGRFITSEGTGTIILVLTSNMGQSVAHKSHIIFLFGCFCERERVHLGIL